jgi:uncharacterized membrane protein YagU involved in acid resistance
LQRLEAERTGEHEEPAEAPSAPPELAKRWDRDQNERAARDPGEPATVKLAALVSERVFHRELPERAKPLAGHAVHYGFGTTMGGAYGAMAEIVPAVTAWGGLLFGAGLFLLADEMAVPALRLAAPPQRYPVATHVDALLAHFVYGVTCELLRRPFRMLLDRTG